MEAESNSTVLVLRLPNATGANPFPNLSLRFKYKTGANETFSDLATFPLLQEPGTKVAFPTQSGFQYKIQLVGVYANETETPPSLTVDYTAPIVNGMLC